MMEGLPHQLASLRHALLMLPLAALLGGALGVIRPIRRALVPRSSHVIQTQLLMAVVGAAVMIIVTREWWPLRAILASLPGGYTFWRIARFGRL